MRENKRHDPGAERRRYPRLKPSALPFLKSIALGPGTELDTIDISQGGMLVETEVRLRPQMKIHLRLLTNDGVIKLEGTVLRSSIASLKGVPRYQSAILFEKPFEQLNDLCQQDEGQIQVQAEQALFDEPVEGIEPLSDAPFGEFDESSSILTIIAQDMCAASAQGKLKLNDW